jgi:glycosyltransferase involved in cell wall biosynthesis
MGETAARPALSFVVPVYNEEGNVAPLHEELTAVARAIGRTYELVFVNDGSRDRTLERLLVLAEDDPRLRVVELDGNFGEAAALSAGFATAAGEVVVTMDGDGQNDPADVPKLLAALEGGYDAVSGRRERRQEDFARRVLPSLVANRLIALATGVPAYDCGCGLKAYRRRLVEGTQLPRGFNRFLPAILGVDPARVTEIPTRDRPRGSGQSHYGLSRVAVVFRDLPSLPLLTRVRAPLGPLATTLGVLVVLFGAGAAVAAARAHAGLALLALAAALVAWAARHNVARMARARAHGVFRVREVHHGRERTPDRDRRRRILGQEPAPHVR